MKKLLVIEDDLTSIKILSSSLSNVGELTIKNQIEDGYKSLIESRPDLLLLDLSLPDGNGLDLLRKIQTVDYHLPVIILSGNESENIKVDAFNLGVVDYIQKPYSSLEMRARVERFLKFNFVISDATVIEKGPIKLNIKNHSIQFQVNKEIKTIELTKKEFLILKTLMENTNSILNRETIMNKVWGNEVFLTDRTIDTHLAAVRKKMDSYGKLIKSIRGVGYQFSFEKETSEINQNEENLIAA